MKTNKLSLRLLRYELWNTMSNVFTFMFGVILPIFLGILFSSVFSSDPSLTPEAVTELKSSFFISMIMIIPLATMLIGYAANYSQEIESGVLQRFKLFGYKESTLLAAKLIANLVYFTAALVIYTAVMFPALGVSVPNPWALVTLYAFVYVFAAVLLVLSHAIATFMKRFGATYGVTMALYFIFMIFGGMMGLRPEQLPGAFNTICRGLPMYYIVSSEFTAFWNGAGYNFLGMGLTLLGFAAVAAGLAALSIFLTKKGSKKPKVPKPVYYD